METIIYAGNFGLPQDATGLRVYNVACILRKLGYEVIFVSNQNNQLRAIEYDGFSYFFADNLFEKGIRRKIKSLKEFFTKRNFFQRIQRIFFENEARVIILYNEPYFLTKRLLKWQKKEKFKLVSDVTEWYEKRGKKYRITERLIPELIEKRICKLDPKVGNIICISPFLYDFYLARNCNTVWIPPVFEIKENRAYKIERVNRDKIKFVYAGSPGNKDILEPFIKAIMRYNEKKNKYIFDIVGVEAETLGFCQAENKGVFFHGRLSHEETLEYIKSADFGVLLRKDAKYARAGFSTKFAECMSNGVAMFCNKINGPEMLIESYENGILVDDYEEETLFRELEKIACLQADKISKIRESAFEFAEKTFNRTRYLTSMKNFIGDWKEV